MSFGAKRMCSAALHPLEGGEAPKQRASSSSSSKRKYLWLPWWQGLSGDIELWENALLDADVERSDWSNSIMRLLSLEDRWRAGGVEKVDWDGLVPPPIKVEWDKAPQSSVWALEEPSRLWWRITRTRWLRLQTNMGTWQKDTREYSKYNHPLTPVTFDLCSSHT